MKETLEEEGGITQVSLRNIAKLYKQHGKVKFVEHWTYGREQTTEIFFEDGFTFVASGFGCGYVGEGSYGLLKVIELYLRRTDITIDHITAWKGDHTVYLLLRGDGQGRAVSCHSGVQDCEYDLEVW